SDYRLMGADPEVFNELVSIYDCVPSRCLAAYVVANAHDSHILRTLATNMLVDARSRSATDLTGFVSLVVALLHVASAKCNLELWTLVNHFIPSHEQTHVFSTSFVAELYHHARGLSTLARHFAHPAADEQREAFIREIKRVYHCAAV